MKKRPLLLAIGGLLAMAAGLFHVINHAVFKGLLFLCAGAVVRSISVVTLIGRPFARCASSTRGTER